MSAKSTPMASSDLGSLILSIQSAGLQAAPSLPNWCSAGTLGIDCTMSR